MRKHVIIINGSGGVGKDTICEMVSRHWKVSNISSITPICAVARAAGWNGEKTAKARKFLSDLKTLCTEFNDLSQHYLIKEYEKFLSSENEILFVHIREPEQIERFKKEVKETSCYSILITRPKLEKERGPLGNQSDDEVANYCYDFIFENDVSLDLLAEKVWQYFSKIMKPE